MPTDVTAASSDGLGTDCTFASGSFTSDGNATQVTLGFVARFIMVVNETDNIVWTKIKGMQVVNSIKEAAGAQTIDTTSAILIPVDAGLNEGPGNAILLSAALCGTGKAISWIAQG